MVTEVLEKNKFLVYYGDVIEEEICQIKSMIEKNDNLADQFDSRWLAIKLIERDAEVMEMIAEIEGGALIIDLAKTSSEKLEKVFSDDPASTFADKRYGWINGLVKEAVTTKETERISISDRIDRFVTNRILGIPIFLALMWMVFKITTDVAGPFLDWVDAAISGPVTNLFVALLEALGLSGTWLESMVVDGVVAGVGGVLVFVPVMFSLYFALALLEDSGYMARAAFVMDRFMQSLGLHGKSFVCMIVGFGCTVPACYATRTLENEKDRVLTGLLVPFMSCGARLPVYVLFSSIFFPQNSNIVIFLLYITGIAMAVLMGVLLNRSLFKRRERSLFVMELPPYRLPTWRNIWFLMWERTSAFVRKAFSFIMVTSIVIWLLLAIPVGSGEFADVDVDNSSFAYISRGLSPVLRPTGFSSWQNTGAIITGFVAKEVVVSTMGQIFNIAEAEEASESTNFFQDLGYLFTSFFEASIDTIKTVPLIFGIDLFGGEEESNPSELMTAVQSHFEAVSGGHGALASVAFMVFILLYTPCMVAVSAQIQEFGAKWAIFGALMQLGVAYLMAVVVFQGGLLLNLG